MRTFQYCLMISMLFMMISTNICSADDEIVLVVRADDMGAGHAVNVASIQVCEEGIARTVEVMVPTPWYPEAVKMLNEHPNIDVGIHLTLTSEWENIKWRPLTNVKTFVNEMGFFHPMTWQNNNFPPNSAFLTTDFDLNEVEKELRAQIERAVKDIPRITHVTSHMGTASCTPELKSMLDRILKDYNLKNDLLDYNAGVSYGEADGTPEERESALIESLEKLTPGTYMTVIHPGLDTPEMQAMGHVGYENVAADRAGVTYAFTSENVKDVIKRRNIRLASYKDVMMDN